MSKKSQSPSGSSTDQVNCEFLVSNIRPSTLVDVLHSHFSSYGQVTDGKYLHVHPFTLKNHHSVLTFTRAYVITMSLTNDMKGQILCHRHIIHGLKVSVQEYKGELHHMKQLNGFGFKFHFLLQSFTNLRYEPHVIKLLEDHFDGINCRIRLLQSDYDGVKARATTQEDTKDRYNRVEPARDWYFDEDDRFPFKGDAVISFYSQKECDKAKEIAKRYFQGCRISKWDPKQERSEFQVLAAMYGL